VIRGGAVTVIVSCGARTFGQSLRVGNTLYNDYLTNLSVVSDVSISENVMDLCQLALRIGFTFYLKMILLKYKLH